MHTLARPPVREARLTRQAGIRAFTLIELLTVIAIIAILAAITFGVIKGVNERAAISQAKTELSSLAQALEAYKLQYGDYPQAGTNAAAPTATAVTSSHTQYFLFNALVGKLGPKSTPAAIAGKSFVEVSKFSLLSTVAANQPAATGSTAVANAFIDPWGRLYIYYYRGSTAWTKNTSYILYSTGPDGTTGLTIDSSTGLITVTTANERYEADNIYANARPPTN